MPPLKGERAVEELIEISASHTIQLKVPRLTKNALEWGKEKFAALKTLSTTL